MNSNPMNRWGESARLAAFGAAYFLAAGAFMSYWPVWLRDRGITDPEIGTLFMARQLVSVAAMLGMGFVAHRLGRLRALLFGLSLAGTVMMGAYQFSYTFFALLMTGLIWGIVWSPIMALYDGVLVNEARRRGIVYGRLRMWGSVAFIVGTLITGVAVDRYGPPSVLFVGTRGRGRCWCRARSCCRGPSRASRARRTRRRSACSISSATGPSCCS